MHTEHTTDPDTPDQAINELCKQGDRKGTALLLTRRALDETLAHITTLEDNAGRELGHLNTSPAHTVTNFEHGRAYGRERTLTLLRMWLTHCIDHLDRQIERSTL